MAMIGFSGGSSVAELGSVDEVQLFFDCIASYAVPSAVELDWTPLTDRLYRKCITVDQAPQARALMERVKTVFDRVASSSISRPTASAVTKLDWTQPTLGGVFAEYFSRFVHCNESAELYFKSFDHQRPLRVVITDLWAIAEDKRLPIEAYDAFVGEPQWKQVKRPTALCVPNVAANPKPPRFYRATERFEVGDRVDHALFGQGVVEGVNGGKMTVCFEDARRVLVQAKS